MVVVIIMIENPGLPIIKILHLLCIYYMSNVPNDPYIISFNPFNSHGIVAPGGAFGNVWREFVPKVGAGMNVCACI